MTTDLRRMTFGICAMVSVWAITMAPTSHVAAQGRDAGQAAAPARGGGAAPATTGTGVVVGRVVDAATNQPIADATVTVAYRGSAAAPGAFTPEMQLLAQRGGGPAIAGAAPGAPTRIITGPDGRFVFHDLPRGNVQLTVNAPGYVNASVGQSRPSGPGRPLDLGDGEFRPGVALRMWKFAVLSGTIIDEAGEPAVGTQVRVLRRIEDAQRPQFTMMGSTTTDDRGMYRIASLVPGDYVVALPQTQTTMPASVSSNLLQGLVSGIPGENALMDLASAGVSLSGMNGTRIGDMTYSTSSTRGPAPAANGRLMAYPTYFYPAAVSPAQAQVLTLGSGEQRSGVDMQLRLVSTAHVSGIVSGPPNGVGNLAVRLVPAGDEQLGGAFGGFETALATTRADGSFTMIGVPPGQYVARVAKEPRAAIPQELLAANPMLQMVMGGGSAQAVGLYGNASISVGNADVSGVAITLSEGAKISGRVEFVGSGQRPDPRQAQALNIVITSADGMGRGGASPIKIDEQGQFKTAGYPAGRYNVLANGLPAAQWITKSITQGGRDVQADGLDLKDADVIDVAITITDQVAQLAGTVRLGGAAPATSATVVMFADPATTGSTARTTVARRYRTAQAAKTGAYTLGSLTAGDYLIAAIDDADVGDAQDPKFVAALSRVATRVTVGDGEKRTLDLQIVKVVR